MEVKFFALLQVSPLRDLRYSSERLELVEADLECPDHWPR